MNNKEYWSKSKSANMYCKSVHELLDKWKQDTKALISIKRKAYWDNLKAQFTLYKEQHPDSNISIREFQHILTQSTNR